MIDLKKSSLVLGTAALLSAGVIAGCGGSDKPQYCSDLDTLKDSVSALTSVDINAGVIDTVKSDLETIQSDAETVVESAKTDFPSEANALEDSVDSAVKSVQDLPSSPSAADIAAIAANVSAVANAAKSFEETTSSACS